MKLVFDVLAESFLQLALFLLIPFFAWLIFRKKANQPFHQWIGFTKPPVPDFKKLIIVIIIQLLLWTVLIPFTEPIMQYSATTDYSRDGFNITAVLCVLLFSFIKTGLSEEILFRGFLAKRLINTLGFVKGTIIQAVIFGLLHSFIYLSGCGILVTVLVVSEAALSGALSVYMNEKIFNGSIIPSWIFHGICNCIPAFAAFVFTGV